MGRPAKLNSAEDLWWKQGIIYQIYPRSFSDSSGNGVGDLRGIIDRLDYLNDGTPDSLGVDAIWLSPVYTSPGKDFGYDVADYCDIDPLFGDLETFDRLLKEAHKRGIRVIMDLVLNHTSDQHPWFTEARSSRDNPKRDWYIWRDNPNNWRSIFGGSAWQYDDTTEQHYLHLFLPEQPDLNWRNPEVKEAAFEAVCFWLDRGVDGFRLDVADRLIKDEQYRDNPFRLDGFRPHDWQDHVYDMRRPEAHQIWKEFRSILDQYEQRSSVAEVHGDLNSVVEYYGDGSDELHLVFNFRFSECRWSASGFQRAIVDWESELPPEAWPCYTLSNHDLERHASRYSGGTVTDRRAHVAAAMLLTLRGTPFLYYGEEIGMRQVRIPRSELLDPPGRRYWPLYRGRDGCRTPMQWDASPGAGFTAGTPWLRLGPDHDTRNIEAQSADPDSLFSFYRRLIWLRKRCPALQRGSYRPVLDRPVAVMSYLRETADQVVLVIMNFFSVSAPFQLDSPELPVSHWRVLLGSNRESENEMLSGGLRLEPFEVLILQAE